MDGNVIALTLIAVLSFVSGFVINLKVRALGYRLVLIIGTSVANATFIYFTLAYFFGSDFSEYVAWSGIFIFMFSVFACIITSLGFIVGDALIKKPD